MNATETVAAHIRQAAQKQRARRRSVFVLEIAMYLFLGLAAATMVAGYAHAKVREAAGVCSPEE